MSHFKLETAEIPVAFCPNCKGEVTLTATSCERCKAVFDGDSNWRPLPNKEEASSATTSSIKINTPDSANLKASEYETDKLRYLFLIGVLLYMVSLVTPAVHWFDQKNPILYGFQVLLVGALAPGGGRISWFANILLAFGIARYLKGNYSQSGILSMLALILAGTAPYTVSIWVSEESAKQSPSLLQGYYYWLASIAVFMMVAFFRNIGFGSTVGRSEPDA